MSIKAKASLSVRASLFYPPFQLVHLLRDRDRLFLGADFYLRDWNLSDRVQADEVCRCDRQIPCAIKSVGEPHRLIQPLLSRLHVREKFCVTLFSANRCNIIAASVVKLR